MINYLSVYMILLRTLRFLLFLHKRNNINNVTNMFILEEDENQESRLHSSLVKI